MCAPLANRRAFYRAASGSSPEACSALSVGIYVQQIKFYVKHKIFVDKHEISPHIFVMAIEVRLDLLLVQRKMSLTELSERIGISITNLSLLKTGKVKGIRFSTLDSICRELECQPGEILEYIPDDG
jgi:putative transcriptional regulator